MRIICVYILLLYLPKLSTKLLKTTKQKNQFLHSCCCFNKRRNKNRFFVVWRRLLKLIIKTKTESVFVLV